MPFEFKYEKLTLRFKFDAGTSRGVLKEKDSWIIKLKSKDASTFGLGECGPLNGLSVESVDEVGDELKRLQEVFDELDLPLQEESLPKIASLSALASVKFALETAFLDLVHGGRRIIFENTFTAGEPIPINGLVWMGEKDFMKKQIDAKIHDGFDCIKLKIGAIDFDQELELLHYIRSQYSDKDLTLRVDANGAFDPGEALDKLSALSDYQIHSIEQPIAVGQHEVMNELCLTSPIPIALDEELIGIDDPYKKQELLETISPQYIILKPSLIGGMLSTQEWIQLAEDRKIGWWATSALESNIGLNAISQLTAQYSVKVPQGLGTGQLYFNNFDSPLTIVKGVIKYDYDKPWIYSELSMVD